MKNLFVLAAMLVALSVGFAQADYTGSSASGNWTVADMGALDPEKGNAHCYDGSYESLKNGNYNNAYSVTNRPNGWADSFTHGNQNQAHWISTNEQASGHNGFYAYKTGFQGNSTASEVMTSFRAYILSDDHIDAIYLNGVLLNADIIADPDGKGWYVSVEFNKDIDISVLDENELVFVTHNTHSESGFNPESNPTGFAVEYEIGTTAKSNATPEPGTLIVLGLGMVGAAFARRRKK